MGGGGKRVFRAGTDVARLMSRGWRPQREAGAKDSFLSFIDSPSISARNLTAEISKLHSVKSFQNDGKEGLITFVGVCSSSAIRRRAFMSGAKYGREFSAEKGPHGSPKFASRWFTKTAQFPKVKPAVVSTGGGIGAGGQVAAASLVSSGGVISSYSLPGQTVLSVVRFYGNCYRQLAKAHLSAFVVSTAAVGYVMGSGDVVNWMGLIWTSVGTMLAASSANAFNQVLEVANDGRMARTRRRPLPTGRMSKAHALAFAVSAGVTGVALLASQTSALAAELGAANILLYALVYTPLKQIHHVNTWVGAVVGGIPPLLGWAAARGQLDPGAWVLASALYFWQIPHFMALAFLFRGDYAAGGYKMLSLLDTSGKRTALCALRNCVYLLPLGFLAQHWGTTTGYFGAENLVLTMGIGGTAAMFYLRPGQRTARTLFRTSLLYLPILMTAMVVHRIPNANVNVNSNVSAKFDQLAAIDALDAERMGELRDGPFGLEGASGTGESESRKRARRVRAPISVFSAAPFPFLPAPDYS